MLPLKPPASKKCMKNIKHINFPIFDDNGEIFDINTWPSYNGIFNGKDIIIKDTNDILRLSYMVCIMNNGGYTKLSFRKVNTFYFTFNTRVVLENLASSIKIIL